MKYGRIYSFAVLSGSVNPQKNWCALSCLRAGCRKIKMRSCSLKDLLITGIRNLRLAIQSAGVSATGNLTGKFLQGTTL